MAEKSALLECANCGQTVRVALDHCGNCAEKFDECLGCVVLREQLAALQEVRAEGCQCGDDEACKFVRERDELKERWEMLKVRVTEMSSSLAISHPHFCGYIERGDVLELIESLEYDDDKE